jgi:ribonuclease-3
LAAATNFVQRVIGEELRVVTPKAAAQADFKTMLQEKLQAERSAAPRYSVVEAIGPPHKRTFHVEVSWDGGSIRGEGRSIKAAETAAAREALKAMQSVPGDTQINSER